MAEQKNVRKIWNEINATDRAFPSDLTVERLFEVQAKKTPKAIAAIFEDESISYGNLNARADQLAYRLSGLGVGPGDVVGVCLYRSLEYLYAVFAVLKVGASFVPLDHDDPKARIFFQVEDSGAILILSHSNCDERLAKCAIRRVYLDKFNWTTAETSQEPFPSVSSLDSLMYMLYTSGSTGRPKGVEIRQRGTVNLLHSLQDEYRMRPSDRSLQLASISFDNSIIEIFWPLLVGATLVIAKHGGQRNVEYVVNTLVDKSVTHFSTVPSLLRALLDLPQMPSCRSLKQVFSGGEALTLDVTEKFHGTSDAELHNWYGLTETCVGSLVWKSMPGAKIVSLGKPLANTRAYLLDPLGELVALGEIGEICLGGVGIDFRYRNSSDPADEMFVRDPVKENSKELLFRTGDLARLHPDKTIEFIGRKDEQIQLRGFRIEPREIESLLNQRSDVRESVVVLIEHGPNDGRLHAYFVPVSETNSPSPDEIKEYLKLHLPELMVPAVAVQVAELPRTTSGKLDRKASSFVTSNKSTPAESTVDPSVVAKISSIFENVLKCGPVGETDSFFDLGGHSLLAIKINYQITKEFKVKMPLSQIFSKDTPGGLAGCVQELMNQS